MLRELYPDLTPEQLQEVRERLSAYVAVVLRMYERLECEGRSYTQSKALTDPRF